MMQQGQEAGGSMEVSNTIFRVARRKNGRRPYERERPRENATTNVTLHLCRTVENELQSLECLQVVD